MNLVTKLEIIGLSGLLLAIGYSVSYGGDVDLPGFGKYQDGVATYAYNNCKKILQDDGKYSCKNFILTLNGENGGWNKDAKPKNKNGTTDNGLCQLNSAYHSKFIKSEDFKDPFKQIDYCLGVWQDAKRRNTMPRYAYKERHKRDKGIVFKDDNTIDNIDEPQELDKQGPTEREYKKGFVNNTQNASVNITGKTVKIPKGTPLVNVKKVCRTQTIDIKKGEYLEISYLGKIRMRIKNLWKGDAIQICRDIK